MSHYAHTLLAAGEEMQYKEGKKGIAMNRCLQDARVALGWTQQELAERLGTSYVTVSRWESGISRPLPRHRARLCTLFAKSEADLGIGMPTAPRVGKQTQTFSSPDPATLCDLSRSHQESSALPCTQPLLDSAMPQHPAQLVGRQRECTQLVAHLCDRRPGTFVALHGLPGVGKTALATMLTYNQEIRAHFRDGVLWAALGPNPNVQGLLSRWGLLLGLPPSETAVLQSSQAWAKALRHAIGTRSFLIVIDDVWNLKDVLPLKIGGLNCRHLITTRFPAVAMQLSLDKVTCLEELGEEESMLLLRQLVPSVVECEAQRAKELVKAVGGLPLALTLMGKYLHKLVYSGQSRRITTALQQLSDASNRLDLSEVQDPLDCHPSLSSGQRLSLHALIAVSDKRLSDEARQALYALSLLPVKPKRFSEETALTVATCSLSTLDELAAAGLLECAEAGRYSLHQVIADYAHLHLRRSDESKQANATT